MLYARWSQGHLVRVFAARDLAEVEEWRRRELPIGARVMVKDSRHILAWPSMTEFWRWLQAEIGLSRLQDLDEAKLKERCMFFDHCDEQYRRVVISWVLSFAHDTKQALRQLAAQTDLSKGKVIFPCWFFGYPNSTLDPQTRLLTFEPFRQPAIVWVVWGKEKPPRNDLQLAASCDAVWWTKNGALKLAAGLVDPTVDRSLTKNDITYAASNPANFRWLTRFEIAELPNYVSRP